MEFKNKTGYILVPSEEQEPVKESPLLYNHVDGKKDNNKKKKKDKEERGNNKRKLRERKAFWVCFSNVQIGTRVLSDDENKKKRKELDDEFKVVKEKGILFSNVEIEPEEEEDREEIQELVGKIMSKKSCFLVCFSNIQVAK